MSKHDKPRVFSYIRFSSSPQSQGDSEARQKEAFEAAQNTEAAKAFAARHGLELDDSLQMIDRALSGFKGLHRTKGHLGRFLKCVEAGDVPRGSILVIEKFTRLGREGVKKTLQEVVFKLLENGITIATLAPEMSFHEQSIETGQVFILIGLIMAAHGESKDKSDYGRRNWRKKRAKAREEKKLLTRKIPAWLRVTKDGRFEAIPEAETTINLMFAWKHQGLGARTIEAKLNREAPWQPPGTPKRKGTGWRSSYIRRILQSRAVIGEHQPREWSDGKWVPAGPPLVDYFPVIVKPELFNAVQERFEANRGHGGQTGKVGNLLTHIARCAYCQAPMAFIDKGGRSERTKYLICDNGRRRRRDETSNQKCAGHSIRYDEVERLVLENCPRLRPEEVLPDRDAQTSLCQSLRQRVAGKETDLKRLERQIGNLMSDIADTDAKMVRTRLLDKVKELEEAKAKLEGEKTEEEKQLAEAERSSASFTRWQKSLAALRKALSKGDAEVRLKTRAHLGELIEQVVIFAVGHRQRHDPEAERKVLAEYRRKLHSQGLKLDPAQYRHDRELQRALDEARDGEDIDLALWALGGEIFPDQLRDKAFCREFGNFVEHILQRRMTKEGRFARVFFRGGGRADLVPKGSLASGLELNKDGCTFIRPDFEKLWDEHQAKHRTNGEAKGKKYNRL
jgi:hypothetical protein